MVTIDDIWILKISQVILFYFMHFSFHFFSSRCKKTLSITLSTSNRHSIFSFSNYSLQAHKSPIFHLSFLRLQHDNYAAFQVPSFPTLHSDLSLILFHAMSRYYIYSTHSFTYHCVGGQFSPKCHGPGFTTLWNLQRKKSKRYYYQLFTINDLYFH